MSSSSRILAFVAVALVLALFAPGPGEAREPLVPVTAFGLADEVRLVEVSEGRYEGTLEQSGARVRLVLREGESSGVLVLDGVPRWVQMREGAIDSVVSDGVLVPAHTHDDQLEPPAGDASAQEATAAADSNHVLSLRILADHSVATAFPTTWFAHAQDVVFLVEWIYWAHFGAVFETEYVFWPNGDPYGAPAQMCGGVGTYIRNVRDYEEIAMPVATRPHEIAHVLTARPFPDAIGCAYIGAVDTPWAYSITHFNAADQLNLKRDALIMAHEIGHNFGGLHERAAPTPGGSLSSAACTGIPVTIMYPGCQTLEPPIFSNGVAQPVALESFGVMRDGGNMPWMIAYSWDKY